MKGLEPQSGVTTLAPALHINHRVTLGGNPEYKRVYYLPVGGELLPDFFLGDVDNVKGQWSVEMDGQATSASGTQSPSSSGGSDTPASVFNVVRTLLSPEITSRVGATFLFVLDGENPGHWLLDLKNGSGSCEECSPEAEADVTMTTDSQMMVDMFQGKVGPTSAFMSGKLKIKGNMAAAMQLETLMGKIKSKL